MDPEEEPYCVEEENGGYRVIDPDGRVMLACGDEGTARHQAALLNSIYHRGYKAGYRHGKQSA